MKKLVLAAASALVVLAAAPALAADIDNAAQANSTAAPFGTPATATYGQTFTVDPGDNFLRTFSLFLNGNGASSLTFRGYVATWTGTTAGTLLYSSDNRTLAANNLRQEFSFAPDLAVTPGSQYVAFLSVSQVGAQPNNTASAPISTTSTIANGKWVYQNNGENFTQLFSTAWNDNGGGFDLAFRADFEPTAAAAVPEPATWGMMLLGFGLAGASMRSRRRSTTVTYA